MIYFLPFAKKIKKRIKKKEKEKWPMGFFPQGRYTLLYYLILEGITNCQKIVDYGDYGQKNLYICILCEKNSDRMQKTSENENKVFHGE
jgi:hypothetical protein